MPAKAIYHFSAKRSLQILPNAGMLLAARFPGVVRALCEISSKAGLNVMGQ